MAITHFDRFGGLVLAVLLAGCGSGDSRIAGRSEAELISSLSSHNWATREAAAQELTRRGVEESGPAVLQAWEEVSDPSARNRLGEILHAWGIVPVSRGHRPYFLKGLATFHRKLELHQENIRAARADWSKLALEDLGLGLGLVLAPLLNEPHPGAREFRDRMVQETHYAMAVVRQNESESALAALQTLSRLLEKEIELQNATD